MNNRQIENIDHEILYNAFVHAPIGKALLDKKGYHIKVNQALCDFLGYTEEELVKINFREFSHPEDLIVDLEYNQRLLDGELSSFQMKKRYIHKSGKIVWGLLNVSKVNVADEVLTIGQVVDITANKQSEIEIDRLKSFYNLSSEAIGMFDPEGNILNVNPAFEDMFGWEKDNLIGMSIHDFPLIPEENKHQADELRQNLLLGQNIREVESKRLAKDGSLLDVMINGFPLKNHQELINGYAIILRDITEKKKAEELMLQSEKLSVAGQLAASIAHEIRNPITAIKGFIKLLQHSIEKKLYYDIVESEIARIELILSELLTLAKPQKSNLVNSDIRSILAQVTSLLEAEANMRSIEINRNFNTGVKPIVCDENQIKQVFINFIKNAIEAMPNGGSICIQFENTNSNSLLISISDTGCGIPKEILAKMGQPFFTTKEKGTGLGFMISKSIIENHDGTVQVSSEENKGTTIKILLPYE